MTLTESNTGETADKSFGKAGLDPKLLERLICPISHGTLDYDRNEQVLISKKAGLVFPIRDGIPILIEDEAKPLAG